MKLELQMKTSQILRDQMISLLLTTKRTTEDQLVPDHNNELELVLTGRKPKQQPLIANNEQLPDAPHNVKTHNHTQRKNR